MKTRFNTYDIVCGVAELQKLVGLRVNQIYDVDNKTYLIRLQGNDVKTVLLLESGTRFHTTLFEWPKNVAPSGFSMKLRKHLKNKRLESFQQLGSDRIVDLQFGVGEAAYHIILELYDRGNIILTDHEKTILYILRPHLEGEEVRFAVREKYPANRAKENEPKLSQDEILSTLDSALPGSNLKSLLMPLLNCGPSVIDHVLTKHKLYDCVLRGKNEEPQNTIKKKEMKYKNKNLPIESTRLFNKESDIDTLMAALEEANEIMCRARIEPSKGYIIQSKEEKPTSDDIVIDYFYQNIEYHPYLFAHCESKPYLVYDSFMVAIDEFYSSLEGQKIDMKTMQQERDALKKLFNVKKDHAKRLSDLSKAQECDIQKAELITRNQSLVDNAILAIRSAIANQMSWPDIHELVKGAQANKDPVAIAIKQLKLEINHISLTLSDPYQNSESNEEELLDNEDSNDGEKEKFPSMVVDIDLALSAWSNARKYYDKKRSAAQKEQKTIDASQKALKSAERKTQQALKDVRTISTITKARKVFWFEKFYWFISSENYLVIGGRDAQQNEIIVKRYMRSNDIYVHAEIQGASSVIIRNPTDSEIPPKTLLEAGTMAISYSVAWDAKVVTNAYWVRSDQVSKTAPTGEYLGTGSFMVRGKKNFLPPCHLIMGLSLFFKLEESFVDKHRGDRKVRAFGSDITEELVKDSSSELESIKEEVVVYSSEKVVAKSVETTDYLKSEPQCDDELDVKECEVEFPDTQVKIEHDTGLITLKNNLPTSEDVSATEILSEIGLKNNATFQEDVTLISAAPSRKKQQLCSIKNKGKKNRTLKSEIQYQKTNENTHSSDIKRGQKGKLKKIKSKYKDQDEEERALRMEILKSAGNNKMLVADVNEEKSSNISKDNKRKIQPDFKHQIDLDDGEEISAGADVEVIDSLTGQPFEDDELIFAIPVIAPYQALQNCKFKVKLTPGTGKRGRVVKTALMMFSKDKNCSARERDLLKGIKEESLARNIPGKVKLSAPQLQKLKT